jgi:hypothetical protein
MRGDSGSNLADLVFYRDRLNSLLPFLRTPAALAASHFRDVVPRGYAQRDDLRYKSGDTLY